MKRLLSITALALVIALSLAFTGCSGAQKDASANFQGSWKDDERSRRNPKTTLRPWRRSA